MKKKASVQRLRKTPKHHSFRLSKNIKPTFQTLPSGWWFFKKSISHLWQNKKVYSGIAAVHGIFVVIFVRGSDGGFDIPEVLNILRETGNPDRLSDSLSIVGAIFRNIGYVPSENVALYQFMIFVMVSLATIWALRRTRKKEKITTRDAFYNGMTALVPFSGTLLLILAMLLPLALADFITTRVLASEGLAVTFVEQALWWLLTLLLVILSIYLIVSSVFAVYIVTMPGIGPIVALLSSRNIVRFRRFSVIRKLLFLGALLSACLAIILLPIIMFAPVFAEPIYYVIVALSIVVAHAYLYNLYREML